MKNLSLILNVVLLVAVIILYVLHFSGPGKVESRSSGSDTSPVDLKVAYINSDSVLKYYDYLKVNRDQLETKTKKMDQDLRNRTVGLQNEITAYQRNVSGMTLGQARAAEEDLGKKQQNRSEERRVGKERRARRAREQEITRQKDKTQT